MTTPSRKWLQESPNYGDRTRTGIELLVLKHMVGINRCNQNQAGTALTRFAYFRSTAIDAELNYRSTAMKPDNE